MLFITKIKNPKIKAFIFCLFLIANHNALAGNKENNSNKDLIYPKTNIKGSLFITIGAIDSKESSESLHMTYENKIKLKTKFNPKNELITIIESGNAINSPLNFDLQSKKGESLKLSSLYENLPSIISEAFTNSEGYLFK